jgi:hypothetical protein
MYDVIFQKKKKREDLRLLGLRVDCVGMYRNFGKEFVEKT